MPRLVAWELLRSNSLAPLLHVDAACEAAGLDARDRGFVRRLVGTEVRRRGTLRALVKHFAHGKPNPDLVAHLHLGLVQLFFLDRVPDHAAINETSSAVHRTSGGSKVRYVNGILRSALRARNEGHCGDPRRDIVDRDLHLSEPVFSDPAQHPYLWAEEAYSMPAPLIKRWTKRYGEERARELARSALDETPVSVRSVGHVRDALRDELAVLGLDSRVSRHPDVFVMASRDIEGLRGAQAFAEGRATVQGESALRAAELLEARADEMLVDLCAAPGGKTAVLAEAGAHVIALDVSARRIERLIETLGRLSVADRVRVLVADGSRGIASECAAGVLVDAPCSNTGVLAQRPEARWRHGPAARRSLVELQTRLIDDAARLVRPGGRLVWSTCSLEPEENQQRVAAFLAAHPDWSCEAEHEILPDPLSLRSGEFAGPIDGGYAARLRRPL